MTSPLFKLSNKKEAEVIFDYKNDRMSEFVQKFDGPTNLERIMYCNQIFFTHRPKNPNNIPKFQKLLENYLQTYNILLILNDENQQCAVLDIALAQLIQVHIPTSLWRKLGTDVSFVVVMSPPLFMQTTFVLCSSYFGHAACTSKVQNLLEFQINRVRQSCILGIYKVVHFEKSTTKFIHSFPMMSKN